MELNKYMLKRKISIIFCLILLSCFAIVLQSCSAKIAIENNGEELTDFESVSSGDVIEQNETTDTAGDVSEEITEAETDKIQIVPFDSIVEKPAFELDGESTGSGGYGDSEYGYFISHDLNKYIKVFRNRTKGEDEKQFELAVCLVKVKDVSFELNESLMEYYKSEGLETPYDIMKMNVTAEIEKIFEYVEPNPYEKLIFEGGELTFESWGGANCSKDTKKYSVGRMNYSFLETDAEYVVYLRMWRPPKGLWANAIALTVPLHNCMIDDEYVNYYNEKYSTYFKSWNAEISNDAIAVYLSDDPRYVQDAEFVKHASARGYLTQ
jgi:hypothetical protein